MNGVIGGAMKTNTERLHSLSALQTTYYANGEFYLTLADAQERAVREGKLNKDGYLEITRVLSDHRVKRWYGKISYGPEKYKWLERIETQE